MRNGLIAGLRAMSEVAVFGNCGRDEMIGGRRRNHISSFRAQPSHFCSGGLLIGLTCLALMACGNGGGNQSVTLTLDSNVACYGIDLDVETGGAVDEASCTASPELSALGCNAYTEVIDDTLQLSVRGCPVPGGTTLFTCSASSNLLTHMRELAEVRCGCGCAEACPMTPELVVCHVDDSVCRAGVASRVAAEPHVADDIQRTSDAQSVATTSSTLFSGTFCDVLSEPTINLERTNGYIQELEFEISLPGNSDAYCPDIQCGVETWFDGPTRQVRLSQNRLRICVSATTAHPMRLPQVASCYVASGGDDQFTFSNIKALDGDLRPIVPAPTLLQE